MWAQLWAHKAHETHTSNSHKIPHLNKRKLGNKQVHVDPTIGRQPMQQRHIVR